MLKKKCEVISNIEISPAIFELTIRDKEISDLINPGQFLHIKPCRGNEPILRRPISICEVKGQDIILVYHIIGKGTYELSLAKQGECIDIIGPIGNGFPIFKEKRCAVVGGGIGIAPILELSKKLDCCDAFLGFRTNPYKTKNFETYCDNLFVATEDGSYGYKGYATDILLENIKDYEVVYTCGPKVMMKKVVDICKANSVECYVSLEERMGCGIGACLVCSCKVKEADDSWHYKKVCTDGPVFKGEEVVFGD